MIEAGRADHSRAKLDHDLIVPITTQSAWWMRGFESLNSLKPRCHIGFTQSCGNRDRASLDKIFRRNGFPSMSSLTP